MEIKSANCADQDISWRICCFSLLLLYFWQSLFVWFGSLFCVVEWLNTPSSLYQMDWLIAMNSLRLKTWRVDLIRWLIFELILLHLAIPHFDPSQFLLILLLIVCNLLYCVFFVCICWYGINILSTHSSLCIIHLHDTYNCWFDSICPSPSAYPQHCNCLPQNRASSMLYGWCDAGTCSSFTKTLLHIDPCIHPKDFEHWFVSPKGFILLLCCLVFVSLGPLESFDIIWLASFTVFSSLWILTHFFHNNGSVVQWFLKQSCQLVTLIKFSSPLVVFGLPALYLVLFCPVF